MATFTMEFRKYIEYYGTDHLGFSTYPIFEENHREVLNQKIIDRYYHREIGTESVEVFSYRVRRKLNEIMPRYNQLYETERLEFNPISTIDIHTLAKNTENTESEAESHGTGNTTTDSTTDTESTESAVSDSQEQTETGSESTGEGTNRSRSVASQTPQTMLSGDEDYATSAQDNNGASTTANTSVSDGTSQAHGESESTGNSNETRSGVGTSETNTTANQQATLEGEQDSRTTGYQGVPADLLIKFRKTILNIDLDILEELDELFMQIWNTSDSYTNDPFYFGGYY